ncbi:hypothetical protein LZ554_007542 [Drepanopeziza brunnea f. sp. 'monogermtubi']|nr:hypothetical protein LZ554_007542 [Drepanopeziza brunnea f. sp. 'monogermtubi']
MARALILVQRGSWPLQLERPSSTLLKQPIPTSSLQDAFPSSSPRYFVPGIYGRLPPGILYHPRPAVIPIPLPRGPKIEHPIQPVDEILRLQILDIHGCWIRHSFRNRSLADIQEQVEGMELRGDYQLKSAHLIFPISH